MRWHIITIEVARDHSGQGASGWWDIQPVRRQIDQPVEGRGYIREHLTDLVFCPGVVCPDLFYPDLKIAHQHFYHAAAQLVFIGEDMATCR